jgi:hypothetical protein
MLNAILMKRAWVLVLVIVLSVLVTATTALAATKFIRARRGGVIRIAPRVLLIVPPRSLSRNTVISAYMYRTKDQIRFEFGPDGTTFARPAKLLISWRDIDDADDLTLYGEDGERVRTDVRRCGVVCYIEHFSLYYFRRR